MGSCDNIADISLPTRSGPCSAMESAYSMSMDTTGLDMRLVEQWQEAGADLCIRVTAPAELRDAKGTAFVCEAFIHDFGSAHGGAVVSQKTERRVRQSLRSLGDRLWYSGGQRRQSSAYVRKHFIEELIDWRWFGDIGKEPSWYSALAD